MTAPVILHPPLHCPIAPEYRGAVAVIGNMDGVHLGHQALVAAAVQQAKQQDCPCAAIVFDPHPRRVFAPDTPPFMLTDLATKSALLHDLGVEFVMVLPFVPDLFGQSPEQFVRDTLGEGLGLAGMVTGEDFQFGAGREGTVQALRQLGDAHGMTSLAVKPVIEPGGEKYSSSSVRKALRAGDPTTAAQHLGRHWSIYGKVEEGRRLARTLSFPTANISLSAYLRPQFGVYAITLTLPEGTFPGVANIGVRPTVDGNAEWLEAHLFDVDIDLYGKDVGVAIHHFLRPEQKFDGLDALKAQIAKDCDAARKWFDNQSPD